LRKREKSNWFPLIADGEGPSVDTSLDDVVSGDSSVVGKHTLASRKVTSKAPKKGKLGAQRVDASFDDLERQAEEVEKRRQESLASRAQFEVAKNADEDRSKCVKLKHFPFLRMSLFKKSPVGYPPD
jgi:hypothetical protein